jgi:hypothetical protein
VASFGRRAILSSVFGIVAFIALTGHEYAGAFMHGRIKGLVGGGGKWTGIVKDWKAGLSLLAKQAVILGYAQADLAEALGLKKQAALLRGQAQSLEKKGDTLGGSDLEEFGKNSLEVQSDINRRIKGAAKLSVAEKAAIVKGAAKVIPATVKTGVAGFRLFKTSQAAASAGAPKPSDEFAVPVAAEIPQIIPKAVDVVPKLFKVANDFRKILVEKDIAVPDMPDAPSFS